MIRGRITTINGMPASEWATSRRDEASFAEGDADGPRASSGRNLTFAGTLPDENRIVAGQWWPEDYEGPPLVSMEREMANRNEMSVGDDLVFTIQGREVAAEIASIRSVAWDNMQPNFYIIFSPGSLDDFPSTYMTSFNLPAEDKLFLNELLRKYPTMTVLEVDALIEQIKTIIAQVTMAIELVLVLIMVSGALVLLASIQASMDERFKEHAILRTLGASRNLVMGSLIIEFCALGLFAGLLATFGAEITVYGLETQIFELDYAIDPQLWLLGPIVGMVLIGLIGTLATLKVVRTPPIIVLRGL
ncbi:MAG: FtsX-like permease family protein [Gammaproteobacteria bacterium]|nr:FtsX-like permease family protein [Gammaproteobacteria bacterium]